MRFIRIAGLALVIGGLVMVAGCVGSGQTLSDAGHGVAALAGPIGAVNPLVGVIMSIVGAGLTGYGEYRKRVDGR